MAKEMFTDNKRVKDLVKLMADHGLTEIELVEDKASIRLKRDLPQQVVAAAPAMLQAAPVHAAPVAAVSAAAASTAGAAVDEEAGLIPIKSPMIGTFYTAANPESEPYVKVGSRVQEKTVVCIIEAMKVFNEIHAEASGTVVKMLVQNGQAVEYNQPLFLLKP
ncbi:MAG: acetyl-CoA carboxylase biotin carboxyl carrier protein [Phycisphaerae bacterium]